MSYGIVGMFFSLWYRPLIDSVLNYCVVSDGFEMGTSSKLTKVQNLETHLRHVASIDLPVQEPWYLLVKSELSDSCAARSPAFWSHSTKVSTYCERQGLGKSK